ncbi:MAG: Exonuclease RNase and polymerase [Frankiales bacterium]|nr:Exonuclease RNase and polymerase [Frankiales bacterium]
MTGWHKGPMLAFDTESCGLPAHDTAAVQIGLARLNYPGTAGPVCHTWLVNPGRPIHPEAVKVHGITDEMVQAEGKPYAETLEQVAAAVIDHLRHGWPLIVFNGSFDCTLLEAELTRLGLPTITGTVGRFAPVIDPFVLDKRLSRRKGSRKLVDQCAHYQVRIDGAHDAGADALAAARVAWRIAETYPAVAQADVFDLHQEQIHWHQEQKDSLRAYFDGKGITHDGCDGRWPVQLPVLTEQRVAS